MRASAFAIASLLVVVVLPVGLPSAQAAQYPVAPFVVFSQAPGGPVQTYVSSLTSQGDAWTCTVADTSLVAVDVTVTCTSQSLLSFVGECSGVRVGAQAGTGYPVGSVVLDLIAPVIAPPPVVSNPLAAATWLQLDGACGNAGTGVGFVTPGADADQAATPAAATFTCTIHVDAGVQAAPWNAFCLGLP